jgi:SPP1 gp7 family putative phage head morphogenesis protein
MLLSGVVKLFKEANTYDETISNDKVERIIQDIDIASALQKLERAVAGRKILPYAKNPDMSDLEKEIQQRFSGIKFNRIINHLITARYFGYSCFEIVYNEDFSIDTLIPIPYDYINYDTRTKEWEIKVGSNKIPLTREKFLLCIHKWNPARVTGTSIFECCQQAFLDKSMFQRQLREIAEKYGDLIVIYPYDVNMEEKEREVLRKSVENIRGASSIGAPVDFNEEFDLKKVIDFIKLSDLDPSIYTELENREKEKLIQNILGSTLTMDNGGGAGSYSLGQVHQDGFEQVVEEICKFVTDSLFQLLEIDSMFFGYNPKDFEFVLEKIYTEADKVEQEKEKENLKSIKLDNMLKLSNIGYKLSKVYLAEYLGIDEVSLEESSAPMQNGILRGEFSKTNNVDDRLFNTVEAQKKFEEYLKKKLDKFTENIEEQIIEQLKKIEEGGEFTLNLDYSELEDDLILSQIRAYATAKAIISGLSLDEFDPFNMPFQEAIKSFIDKTPILYETIEEITEEVRAHSFWLKKSTDLEMTSKLFENMKKSLETGTTFKQWVKDSKETVEKLGLGKQGYYLENVYRTNMFSQYSIGNYKQLKEDEEFFPYWQYHAIEDNRTTSICRTLNGKIFKSDNPFWDIYYPPNHYQCRSTVICLSKDDMKEYGYKLSKYDETMTGEELGSFKGNPANKYWEDMEKRANEKQGVFVWE